MTLNKAARFLKATFLLLSICGAQSASATELSVVKELENFVPYDVVKAENSGKNYICDSFDVDTNTCLYVTEEGGWFKKPTSKILIKRKPKIEVRITTKGHPFDGIKDLDCAEVTDVTVEIIGDQRLWLNPGFHEFETQVKNIAKGQKIRGKYCEAYVRSGDGYLVYSYDEYGKLDPLFKMPVLVYFFDEEPNLRALKNLKEEEESSE